MRSHSRSVRGAVILVSAVFLVFVRAHGQGTISAAVWPAALASGGGPGSLGYPYAVFVRIQGWTAAAGASAYVKIYSGSSNEYMWSGSQWSNLTTYGSANQPVVPIDASGNWSGWIYAKHNDALGGSASLRAAKVGATSTNVTVPLPVFGVLNTSASGNGGWISRASSAAANKAIGAFAGGTVLGTYRTEENGIAEGYALGVGGFRIAVPAGTIDSLVAWNDDGSAFSSFVGPWSVSPGVETEATTGGTTIGIGRASILPPTLPGGTVTGIAVRVYGESSGIIRAVRLFVPQRWNWSRTAADVVSPGTVAVAGDSITIGGLLLGERTASPCRSRTWCRSTARGCSFSGR